MTYRLKRIEPNDGAGDSGPMSLALKVENNEIVNGGNRPKVGYIMRVGSIYSRTYANQDYWTTTYITEILEETDNYVKFKTKNSIYEWEEF